MRPARILAARGDDRSPPGPDNTIEPAEFEALVAAREEAR